MDGVDSAVRGIGSRDVRAFRCQLADSSFLSLQSINYNHLLPTRYALELEGLKGSVAPETFKEPTHREEAKKQIKKILEERYIAGKNKSVILVKCSERWALI